ncbi:MAG: Serine hydroxymethyltransferase 2 [Alphaproteobacteria bacterium MarineAlpha5_Bin6]|nr:MAG: Serine hydroxymethyltransferase 2 [Alphaproteobacteria bacterium MarineAlpha5_Bin7]PPR53259.1 MAG: Serine hydroxymethyltransferase 2 [Alphaproteobacteria bacterium MarineAlpha5_Bin6]|tara:strand:- start:424 stop:1710 length:1287 start_codon:yes stop_codon:yes gene_type:complete
MSNLYNQKLKESDPEVYQSLEKELIRQQNQIELIASENICSLAVLNAQGSIMTNKYAEGYPHKRYYGGCEFVDQAEEIALERVKKLYNCKYANLQSHSGAQANQAVFLALLKPHDTILGMSLASGGHLTHGAKPNISGKWFNSIQYGVKKEGNEKDLIDYEEVERLAKEHKPKLIIAGASAYPRKIDWKRFKQISEETGAYFLVDMAHYSGLIAANEYPSPIEFADVVTSTTHKTLRGARSAMILTNNEEIYKKVNSAVFPGLQGGPLMHVMAAKAVAFGEALKPDFKIYIQQVISNAKVLAQVLVNRGFKVVTGGTDSHIVWLDLSPKNLTGDKAEKLLEEVGIACNKNAIPYDPNPPKITSGLRFGTPAATSRGFNNEDFTNVGNMIADALDSLLLEEKQRIDICRLINKKVVELCSKYKIYDEAY